MKRFTLTILLTTLLSAIGMDIFAHDFVVNGIYYVYNDGSSGSSVSVSYRGYSPDSYPYYERYRGNVTIPKAVTHNGKTYEVTCIGISAFFGCTGLTSITISEGVMSIGSDAFNNCSNLTSINIPESVTSIRSEAFKNCSSLTSIIIPGGVTSIEYSTFENCSKLTSIIISEGVTSIGRRAFYNCSSLTSITIPESVTSIGSYTFYNCI